ncbi:MAG: M48 family metallopeptidase [Oscillospiraceae bacterium]|nr:M48 family metallopeptidase [Oscillospiraceae bacterium]
METAYRMIRSSRRTISIQISPAGEVIVRAPIGMSGAAVERFVKSKAAWIEKHTARQAPRMPAFTDAEIRELARQARAAFPERVAYFAPLVGVTYGNITIRSQRTRWGSCSGKGNLNFNCLLMLTPEDVVDYVVVHELCHRKEMNHSPRFWAEVARVLPNYRQSRMWLKEHGQALIGRLK